MPETFPVIWLDQYGDEVSVDRLLEVLETIIEGYESDTRFLSSHGRDYTMSDLVEYRDMVVATTDLVRGVTTDGKTVVQMQSETCWRTGPPGTAGYGIGSTPIVCFMAC